MNKIVGDDQKAFAELFYAYHNQLGAFIGKLTGSMEMTEEIVQDIFVKVWLKRKSLTMVDNFTSYLYILSRNYTLNCIRKLVNDRKHDVEYEKWHSMIFDECEEQIFAQPDNYQSLIDRAIAQLPPHQQQVFTLRSKGLKNPEIARQMNISPDSVKKYQQWALRSVSEFLKAHIALSGLLIIHHLK